MKMKSFLMVSIIIIQSNLIISEFNKSSAGPIVGLDSGLIQGKSKMFRGIEVYQFLCIPYGEPPIGVNRFKRSVPKSTWTGVLSTREWGPYCVQSTLTSDIKVSEDCLSLNVFTTSIAVDDVQKGDKQQLRPVMVWIHGGAFRLGSAHMASLFDGTALAALEDVVIVTINYRLGVFGFLYLPDSEIPGNMGLWDQNLALKWVQSNIIHFGGNPDRVTIFGESAGSLSVSAHIVSPQSEGLFANAIMQSGAIYGLHLLSPKNTTESFLKQINCSSIDQKLCLSSFKFHDHPEVESIDFWPIYGDDFLPVLPEDVVSSSGVANDLNLLIGTVGYEGALMLVCKDPITFDPANPIELNVSNVRGIISYLFGSSSVDYFTDKYNISSLGNNSDELRLQLAKLVGDVILTCPTYIFARDLVKQNNINNVYGYYQSQRPSRSPFSFMNENKWVPVTHSDDILFVFGYPLMEDEKYPNEDLILSSMMINIWTTFAKTGKPPPIGPFKWSNWTMNSNKTVTPFIMELNSKKVNLNDENVASSCFDKWPFPLEKSYNLQIEFGKLSQLSG
ncbi:acetylcholinesterase-like isoform X2 [Panonychus citri]|uniref:acetylcholinesterase-like isoform X2 n=1 Tax=Panonychus citri TaxID=50023 RepID=UPI002307173E|nr:acetylcholinesterase-like isoform X2 [Panonychus citri]